MIESNTVLVLGAGASKTYGFPLGGELRTGILAGIAPGSEFRETLYAAKYDERDVDEFRIAFERSTIYSIDSFLARRAEFVEIGKKVIAWIIKSCEQICESNSWLSTPADLTDHWYQYLWNQLCDRPLDEFSKNKLSIITFNYDRSLETFLRQAFRYTYNTTPVQADQFIDKTIPIVHVYGEVADDFGLPETSMASKHDELARIVHASAQSIGVIPEGRDEAPELTRCRELLIAADRICFLGFGYDKENLARLQAEKTAASHIGRAGMGFPVHRTIIGSAYRLFPAEAQWAAARCGQQSTASRLDVSPPNFPDLRCLDTLRYSAVLV